MSLYHLSGMSSSIAARRRLTIGRMNTTFARSHPTALDNKAVRGLLALMWFLTRTTFKMKLDSAIGHNAI